MTIQLENERISVTILTKGAELASIKNKKTGIEYLWQADPTYWGRHAPVLFPVVGRLKEDSYQVDGKSYPMNQHGFARDGDFEIVEQDDSSVTLELGAATETKRVYPFDFKLKIQYRLVGETVTTHYTVENPSSTEKLYFSTRRAGSGFLLSAFYKRKGRGTNDDQDNPLHGSSALPPVDGSSGGRLRLQLQLRCPGQSHAVQRGSLPLGNPAPGQRG